LKKSLNKLIKSPEYVNNQGFYLTYYLINDIIIKNIVMKKNSKVDGITVLSLPELLKDFQNRSEKGEIIKVLIVEDSKIESARIKLLVSNFFKEKLIKAPLNFELALDDCKNQYDLIFLDHDLWNGRKGEELVNLIREFNKDNNFFIISITENEEKGEEMRKTAKAYFYCKKTELSKVFSSAFNF
jgi:CheY-like chemotaxis protein